MKGSLLMKHKNNQLRFSKGHAIEWLFSHDNNLFLHAHIIYSDVISKKIERHNSKHVHIFRHPKDLAVSWMRHQQKVALKKGDSAPANLLETLLRGMSGVPIPRYYSRYLGWLSNPSTHVFRMESLVSKEEEQMRLYHILLGEDPVHPFNSSFLHRGMTSTGELSRWQNHWNSSLEWLWKEQGGEELMARLGYFD